MVQHLLKPYKGRGGTLNPDGRFEGFKREAFDDGWGDLEQPPAIETIVIAEPARSIIARNDSPDVGFNQSINPYAGCEHGCIYCYARPSHSYRGLSAGLDFETKLFAKTNAAELLRQELAAKSYSCETIVVGANTDPYQPIERQWKITRSVLEVLAEHNHPVGIITKSSLVERDIGILTAMAKKNLVRVHVSITTLDHGIARYLEPRTSAPRRRLQTLRVLHKAGIPVGVMVAPVIPFLTDSQLEPILEAAAEAGADSAGYVLLRLPHEVKDLFKDWLTKHFPLKAEHVMSLVREMRGGRDYDSTWRVRQKGVGVFAELLQKRFELACGRLQLNANRRVLDTQSFRPPSAGGQLSLFEHLRGGHMKQKSVMEALEAANSALQGELENRDKLKEEMQATEPEIREAIEVSEKARSLAQEVQEKEVSVKVLEIAVREAEEALSETQAALEQELEKRKELEHAMEKTEQAIVDGIEKSEEARERLRLETDQPVNGN